MRAVGAGLIATAQKQYREYAALGECQWTQYAAEFADKQPTASGRQSALKSRTRAARDVLPGEPANEERGAEQLGVDRRIPEATRSQLRLKALEPLAQVGWTEAAGARRRSHSCGFSGLSAMRGAVQLGVCDKPALD